MACKPLQSQNIKSIKKIRIFGGGVAKGNDEIYHICDSASSLMKFI
jgi:hypothetical protein